MKSVKVDNPVVGPPPPRVNSKNDLAIDHQNYANLTPVQLSSHSKGDPVQQINGVLSQSINQTKQIEDSQIVATVNGVAILASDVLEPFRGRLQQFKQQATPEQYEQQKIALIRKQLPAVIEQEMLIAAMKQKVSKEQLESFNKQLDDGFAEQVKSMLKRTNSATSQELNEKLKSQGNSLANLRKAFGKRQMAMFYLYGEANTPQTLSRSDLMEYYKTHADEYSHPARAKWQEISISHAEHGGKAEAARVVKQAITELQQGVDFGDVAKKYSDGATAAKGGYWDWTEKESLADANISVLLFTSPVGQISDVYLGENSFKLVKVVEREETSITPLAELQEKIKKTMTEQTRKKETEEALEKLKKEIVIRTMFDGESN